MLVQVEIWNNLRTVTSANANAPTKWGGPPGVTVDSVVTDFQDLDGVVGRYIRCLCVCLSKSSKIYTLVRNKINLHDNRHNDTLGRTRDTAKREKSA